jgi:hypothetical protein
LDIIASLRISKKFKGFVVPIPWNPLGLENEIFELYFSIEKSFKLNELNTPLLVPKPIEFEFIYKPLKFIFEVE